MTLFVKASKVERKLKVLVYGESGVGKTIFGLSFSAAGRVAVIDLEGGTALYGGKHDFDVLRARDFATVIKAVEEIKADAGRTYSTLVIDPITVLWGNLQDAGQQLAERRAQSAARVGGIADVVLTQRDWGIIKRQYTKLMTDLVNMPNHVVLIARQKDQTDKEGNRLGTTFDGEKSTPYLPDIILHMTGGKDYAATIKKDRSGTYPLGTQLKAPRYENFAAAVSHGVEAPLPDDGDAATATAALLAEQDTPLAKPTMTPFEAIRNLQIKLGKDISPDSELTKMGDARIGELGRQLQAEWAAIQQQDVSHEQTPAMPMASSGEPMVTERQIASIRKLCAALGRAEPDTTTMTFEAGRQHLTQLSQAYSEARSAS